MKLIVGLGNPGPEYAGTRHNVGFIVIDRLARRWGWGEFDRLARSKFDGLFLDGLAPLAAGGSQKVLLLKPATFMNASGRAVQAAAAFYQLPPHQLLVVLDDMALPCGKLRLRAAGSHGGHNGLRDIERAVGTDAYPRLRIGIDPPPPRIPWPDYVLGRFTDAQRMAIEVALDRAADAAQTWIEQGIEAAMNRFNADSEN